MFNLHNFFSDPKTQGLQANPYNPVCTLASAKGNTLVLREVAELLESGRAVGAKPLKEYNEVTGYANAAQWVYSQALEPDEWRSDELISLNELRRIHHTAMTAVWEVAPHAAAAPDEGPGNWRRHDIHPFPGGMTPPPWNEVPARITAWVAEVNATGAHLRAATGLPEPLAEQVARLHNLFERVHPFLDGNGRAGRLALKLMLVHLGYPPVIIFKKQGDAYLTALGRADSGDLGPLGELIARAMLDNLNRFIVPSVAGPARLVPLAALANDDFSVAALRQAAQRGRLDAVQSADGTWRTSRQAVRAYKRHKHRRRPKAA